MFSQIQSPFEEMDWMSMNSNYFFPPYKKPSNKWGWILVIVTTISLVLGFAVWKRGKLSKDFNPEEGVDLLKEFV